MISLNAFACSIVRGKPSSKNPFFASSSEILSFTMPTVTSSGTNSPRSMYDLASLPKSVSSLIAFLNMSPVDMCGIGNFLTISLA